MQQRSSFQTGLAAIEGGGDRSKRAMASDDQTVHDGSGKARRRHPHVDKVRRHAGDTALDLLEILGVVDHYTTLNTLSEPMQSESVIRPPA